MHPVSWFGNGTNLWKHNKWSVALKLLELPVAICRASHNIKVGTMRLGTSLAKGADASGSVRKSVSGLLAVVFVGLAAVLGTFWWSESLDYRANTPVLQLYIDYNLWCVHFTLAPLPHPHPNHAIKYRNVFP